MSRTTLPVMLLTVSLAALPAGCTSGGSPGPSSSPTVHDVQAALDIGMRFAACGRSHGHPDLPDPVVTDGQIAFPVQDDEAAQRELEAATEIPECKAILETLPGWAKSSRPAHTAEEIRQLVAFARCLREHGIPEWPDPKSDGTFPIKGTPLEAEGKSQRWFTATEACRQYWDKGIDAS